VFGSLKAYLDLYRRPGPWSVAYVEAATGTVDTLEAADVRPGNVRAELEAKGAPDDDVQAVGSAVRPAEGMPGPVAQFVLARQGSVELNEFLPGPLVVPQRVSVDPVPDLLPLVKHKGEQFPYVVAEVSREGGEIRLHHAGKLGADSVEDIQGSTENLKKVPSGGWSQGKYQHRTEEIWRQNADQVAAEIDRVAARSGAKLVVLSGDIRARGLVQEQLSKASQELVAEVDANTRTAGADPELLDREVEKHIALRWAAEQQQVLDRLAEQEGHANPEAASGLDAVVHALQQGQVDVLVMDDAELSDHQLVVLDAEPWVALDQDESLDAKALGRVAAPSALLRAAALTDARVLIVPAAALPRRADVAALLRWPAGAESPASSSAPATT
jgi:hypothetical protein